jgi:hypothetical protein
MGGLAMFTILACIGLALIGWYADRCNIQDRQNISLVSDEEVRQSVLHARQDLKLIAFLLMAIVVMLGIVADRIH